MKEELQAVKNYLNSFFPHLTGLPAFVWNNFDTASKRTITYKNYKIIYSLITTKDKQTDDWYMDLLNCYEWRKCYKEIKDEQDDDFNKSLLGLFLVEAVMNEMNSQNKMF